MGILHILFSQTTKNLALRDSLVHLVIVNLVLGYHLVLLNVGEEPAVFATLQSTVVCLHVASLPVFITRYSQATIFYISIISVWFVTMLSALGLLPGWSHSASSHHHALPYQTCQQLSNCCKKIPSWPLLSLVSSNNPKENHGPMTSDPNAS